nr:AAA family ATPase [uncultured Desulfuromonas sp.]
MPHPEEETHNPLIESMLKATFYDHPVADVDLIETHISWVFLAGDYAYKVKKPIDFGFLDFSTLAKRAFFCQEELRLNRRLAPQLYLDVVAIGGEADDPILYGKPVIDYAVKMRRFSQAQQLDDLLQAGKLTGGLLESFADSMATFHGTAPRAEVTSHYGTPAVVYQPIEQNFYQIRTHLPDPGMTHPIDQLEEWSRACYARLQPTLVKRKEQGYIRECHGDAHLANMAWYKNGPVFFDCIEFNADLRWIDVMNEVAFLVMDVEDRGRHDLGWRFLNRYLEKTGDYPGILVLNFYKVYRALVRAKVACLRLAQSGLTDTERAADLDLVRSYLNLAESYTQSRQPQLILTHGFSGSGKSSFVKDLAPQVGAVCLHSDHERKRLFGLAMDEKSHSPIQGGIYSADAGSKTYARLYELADLLLSAGVTTIVDATFLKQHDRQRFRQLAQHHHVSMSLLDFNVPEAELRRRLCLRAAQAESVSEAGEEVLNSQISTAEPLCSAERESCFVVTPQSDPSRVAQRLSSA